MSPHSVAVLGGDTRELYLARRLQQAGHDCIAFGQGDDVRGIAPQVAPSAGAAVAGREWLLCPSPGLADGNRVYAPTSPEPIVLDVSLLRLSNASAGGLILGRVTAEVTAAAATLDIPVFEMKDDRALATRLATGVAEGCMALLIRLTTRILRDHRIVLCGYGVTGAVILDYLLAAGCDVTVVARNDVARERARQRGATPCAYDERIAALAGAEVIVNTIPDVESLPTDAFALLVGKLIVDIASPPGGMDHAAAAAAGLDVHWARGLAGGRAPETAGDAQFAFVEKTMAVRYGTTHSPARASVAGENRR